MIQSMRRARRVYGWGAAVSATASLFFAAALWFGGLPGGDVPWGAWRGSDFAFVAPAGWIAKSPRDTGHWKGAARLDAEGASIDVFHAPGDIFRSAATAQGAFFALAAGLDGAQPRIESQTVLAVDGLKAVEIFATGAQGLPPTDIQAILVLAPASGGTLAIRFISSKNPEQRRADFESFLASFRITRRPSSFRRF